MEGLKLSYEYFCKHDIPHNKVGKLIVAQNTEQVKRLDELYDRGLKNNVPDLQLVEKECISKYEAKCQVLKFKVYSIQFIYRFLKKLTENMEKLSRLSKLIIILYREKEHCGHHGRV